MSYETQSVFDLLRTAADDNPNEVPFDTMSTKPESGLCISFDSGDAVQQALGFITVVFFIDSLIFEDLL